MEKEQEIKVFHLINCPHCKEDVYIVGRITPMEISNAFTPAQVQEAKGTLRKMVHENKEIPEDRKTAIFTWIAADNTIFAAEDINDIYDSFKKDTIG